MMSRKVKQQVNSAVNELDMNLANNYKDLAHKALKELDELVTKRGSSRKRTTPN